MRLCLPRHENDKFPVQSRKSISFNSLKVTEGIQNPAECGVILALPSYRSGRGHLSAPRELCLSCTALDSLSREDQAWLFGMLFATPLCL